MPRDNGRLGPSGMVILGILAAAGPNSTYGLKRAIATSVGYFWPFPHAQLYAETARLEQLGLLSAEQEEMGRRRRVYSLDCSARQRSTAPWSPERRTDGTTWPRNSAGRVYCGPSKVGP